MKNYNLKALVSLCLSICVIGNPLLANAQELNCDMTEQIEKNEYFIQDSVPMYEDISEEINVEEYTFNNMEREYTEEIGMVTELPSQTDGISTFSTGDSQENTDPNYAYLIVHEDIKQGILTKTSEMRWYGCILEQTSKVSMMMQSVPEVDVDIYVFQLDQSTNELNLIGGTATSGAGVSEYYSEILNPGIYYFAISAYEGNGQYALAFYATQDLVNEVNDGIDVATVICDGDAIEGIIDNPFDNDYYTFTLTSAMLVNITTDLGDYKATFIKSDSSQHIYKLSNKDEVYQLSAGTYYLNINSKDGTYNTSQAYNISFSNIANIADDSRATYFTVNEPAHIVFQSDQNGMNMYVNGNKIDVSYKYYLDSSNSAGTQVYDIVLENSEYLRAKIYENQFLFEDWETTVRVGMIMPDTVYYHGGSKGTNFIGDVLELSIYSDSAFYKIHCVCSGAYAANRMYDDRAYVTVLIDPNTGKLVDIEKFNYFYDYATGSNSMTYTRPNSYATKYYYPYANGKEPTEW